MNTDLEPQNPAYTAHGEAGITRNILKMSPNLLKNKRLLSNLIFKNALIKANAHP